MRYIHESVTHHGLGVDRLVSWVSRKYFCYNLRRLARVVIDSCFRCQSRLSTPFVQEMEMLHESRLPSSPIFAFGAAVHVDVFGPIGTKFPESRISRKSYGCIFVCGFTRAIHLERLDNLSSEDTLSAVIRFIGRRGPPARFISDQGTNFKGIRNSITRSVIHNRLQDSDILCSEKITWDLITPLAHHKLGAAETMIKSVKRSLERITDKDLKGHKLTTTELDTLFVQVEHLINSRPLLVNQNERESLSLTPNDFLKNNMNPSNLLPEHLMNDVQLVQRHQQIQALLHVIWDRFWGEYLPTLRKCNKWLQGKVHLEKGDLVLVIDEHLRTSDLKWPTAIVEEVHFSNSGKISSVDVRIAGSRNSYNRGVRSLAPLPNIH